MDWLEEKVEQIQSRIKKMPLKQALICYVIVAAAAAAIGVFVIEMFLENWYWIIYERNGGNPYGHVCTFSYEDEQRLEWIYTLQIGIPFICLGISVLGAVILFYRNRLKKPLGILKEAADAIRDGNLDAKAVYDSTDEMGQLCGTFEQMRREVIRDKEKMWKVIEEQREINAAFAHDLRTPLTVLRGYSDFLYRYIPEGKISTEKLTDTLKLMSEHIQRLETYSRTMKKIRNFEEIKPQKEEMDILRLQTRIQEIADALNQIGGIRIFLSEKCRESKMIYADENMILEVMENLLSNGIRYARQSVEVGISTEEEKKMLNLFVKDDGPGFSKEELVKASQAYFRGAEKSTDESEKKRTEEHFGIGLHIASVLCQKHGGVLSTANSLNGGAVVSVSFSYGKS